MKTKSHLPSALFKNGRSSMCDPGQGSGGGGQGLVSGPAEGYCCVYLPDGTASLAPARSGLLLRDLLSGLCEKRGLPLKDVIIYLQGKDKPLSLDQDSSVLRDQQVCLELRVTVVVEVVFTGNTVGIMAKSGKTLQDAVAAILQKHQLRPQDSIITVVSERVCWCGLLLRRAFLLVYKVFPFAVSRKAQRIP
uniref:RBD domain-containing protein n=1 Tax=Denticeps clupeoides TaxID=299321 RepID=A0AAY4CPH8_9TELE